MRIENLAGGNWAEIKPVSGAGWRRAKRKRAEEAREDAVSMMAVIPPDLFDRITSRNQQEAQDAQRQLEELEYHPDNVDHGIVLKEGLTDSSFDVPEDADDPSEFIDNANTVRLVKEIIALTRPPSREQEKNFSSPSPATTGVRATAPDSGI